MPRGQLRIYLGAAPGVGKTFAMLQEGERRRARGADVVVGIVETHGRPGTSAQIGDLEVVPRRSVTYRGAELEEMDLDAILARAPQICLVDELAHTNVPGSRHAKRYEDVEALLEAGIDVISTVNIQHLESLNDVVERITGATQREIIPDALVRAADQVHLVDQTPEALRRRMVHGNIYGPERAEAALANYFRVGNLAALRELALMWVADQVDEGLQAYRERHGISEGWETRERIVVAITGAPTGDDVIRRAARIAGRLRGELIGVRVRPTDGLSGADSPTLEHQRQLLAALGARYREVASGDIAGALIDVARAENATQIVLGSSHRSRWAELTGGSVINDVTRRSGSIDVHVISTAASESSPPSPTRVRPPTTVALSRRRRAIAWVGAVAVPVVITALLLVVDDRLGFASDLLIYLIGSVAVATVGGFPPALVSAVLSSLLLNWYFTEPLRTLTIAEPESLLALVVFVLVTGIIGSLVSRAARRSAEAARSRSDAESLAAMAALTSTVEDPLPLMVTQVRAALGAAGAAVRSRIADGDWQTVAADGVCDDTGPSISAPIDERTELALYGEGFGSADSSVLTAFSSQITTVLDQERLRREAAAAEQLTEVNELRAALLAAVSHDLRTPLAAIKASVSSLRQEDIEWPAEVHDEFLATIEDQTDRLTDLVSNLLGMSRIQSGAVQLSRRAVGVDEVVSAAIAGLDLRGIGIDIDVADDLPLWDVDPALAERVVANLVDNAVKWSPPGGSVRLAAVASGDAVTLRVIDHGPGIAPERRAEVFEPFQRLGDGTVGGTGLGLAVALGLTNVLGGGLDIEETPGGGTTMVLTLDASTDERLAGEAS